MARNDFSLITPTMQCLSQKWLIAAGAMGTTGGYRGEPFISALATAAQTGIAIMAADADGTIGTGTGDGRFAGVAKSDSTQTASVAGVVYTWMPLPGIIYAGSAKSSTAANTAAKIDALRGAAVIFDLTSSKYTIDTAATDASTNAIVITDGNYIANTVYWYVKPTWSVVGNISTIS